MPPENNNQPNQVPPQVPPSASETPSTPVPQAQPQPATPPVPEASPARDMEKLQPVTERTIPPVMIMPKPLGPSEESHHLEPVLIKGAIAAAALFLLIFGYVVYRQYGADVSAWWREISAPVQDMRTGEETDTDILGNAPTQRSSVQERTDFAAKALSVAIPAERLTINPGCVASPEVLSVATSTFTIKNNDSINHTLVFSVGQFAVPAGQEVTVRPNFLLGSLYGFRCDQEAKTAGAVFFAGTEQ